MAVTATRYQYDGDCNADQRYYGVGTGRFLTAYPYVATDGASSPVSWNRYAYVHSDPINFHDPTGNNEADPNSQPGVDPGYPCGPNWASDASPQGPCSVGSGGWGGGDGGGGDAYTQGFLAGKDKARQDLARKDCFAIFGFSTANAAQTWFDTRIKFVDVHKGDLRLQNGRPVTDPAPAETSGVGTIYINRDYNWEDFSRVRTASGTAYNYLAYINRALGSNMRSDELAAFIILHEVEHNRGDVNSPDTADEAADLRKVYNACVK